jgi:arylsulfatase A
MTAGRMVVIALLLSVAMPSVRAAESQKFPARESDSRLRAEGDGWGLEKARIDDPMRPRVLLIGDSILGGYHKHVIAALDGKAYVDVWQNPHWQSEKTNRVLAEVLAEGPYDVVHANMGLHGWPVGRIKDGTFEPLTKAYIEVIRTKLPKAKIIWANSTPVRTKDKPGELDPVINANILEQNRMSATVMAEMNVPVNDFYALLENRLDLAKTDQFHWTPPAYHILGEVATRSINQALATPQAASRPTNFIVIFIDDLGYGDIGPFGATKQKTPHLDRMAAEGMKLTSFYAAPRCSVSRAQLLTGCYGARIGVTGVYSPASSFGLNSAEFTIAERLKPLGYATACIGKWHLGDQPEFLPMNQGFDRYFGIPYSNDMPCVSTVTGESVVPLLRDDKVEQLLTADDQRRIVERYTDEAIAFVRDAKDRPFFLYMPHTAVHGPLHPGERFAGKSGNGRFGDWVEEMDWSVGRILDTLRELELDENTLVVFSSDNGPAGGGSAGPLRGGKGSTWEGGVRVPTIAWWPGHIPPGSACDAVAGTIDLLPTFVKLAGGTLPAEPVIDGRDMSQLLVGASCAAPRDAHFYFQGRNIQAVRQGKWKLVIAPQTADAEKRAGVLSASPESPRLYDLDADIGETTSVAEAHPDVVSQLRLLIEAMAADLATNSRPAGTVANPQMLYPAESREKKPPRAEKRKAAL